MLCSRGEKRERQGMLEEEAHAVEEITFQAYGCPIDSTSSLKYLRLVLTASDNYWMEVVANLSKARQKWDRMFSIPLWEGTGVRTSIKF